MVYNNSRKFEIYFYMPIDQQEFSPPPAGAANEKMHRAENIPSGQERIRPAEQAKEERGGFWEKKEGEEWPTPAYQPKTTAQATPHAPRGDESYAKYKQIEQVLEEDLGEIYNNLTPQEQKNFKIKGEEAARSIFQLVYHKTKIKVKKIVKLIRNWLKSVPGINKFFLEQEAKIKADKIAALADDSKKVEF